jgi:protein-S-isoprenylcysteine O-methyltransferase Ste14
MTVALLALAALPAVSALDHRFGWSQVPPALVIFGDILIVLAYVGFYLVFRENPYGGATIELTPGQTVVTTGPYAVVRHPMYSWALLMLLGIPLALGSWWGALLLVPALAAILWRLQEEEKFLLTELARYRDYQRKVPHRLRRWPARTGGNMAHPASRPKLRPNRTLPHVAWGRTVRIGTKLESLPFRWGFGT